MAGEQQPLARVTMGHVIGRVSDLYTLLRAIDETMPKEANLYLEGAKIAPELAEFLTRHDAPRKQEIERMTIWPKMRIFHLPLEPGNLRELRAIADRYAEPEICTHLAVYKDRNLLLLAPDAGSGEVEVSGLLPSSTVSRFRELLGDALHASPGSVA